MNPMMHFNVEGGLHGNTEINFAYWLFIFDLGLTFFQHPVTWQPSAEGTKLMGHMILRKSVEGQPGDSGAILGKGTLGEPKQKTVLKNAYAAKIMSHFFDWRSTL